MRSNPGTIGYCDEKIKAIKASKRPRAQKVAMVQEWEDKKADIRNGIFDRRSTRLKPADVQLLEAREVIRCLRKENADLKTLLRITKYTEVSDDMYSQFVSTVKTMECCITGKNGLYMRRDELPNPFNEWTRRKLEEIAFQMLRHDKLKRHHDTGILS